MPEKPIMHGRDHRPGGTDPIPGLGASSLPWMGYENFSVSVGGAGTPVSVSMNTGNFDFSDSTIFGQSGTDPEIKAKGIYQLVCAATFLYPSGTPPANSFGSFTFGWSLITQVSNYNAFLKNASGGWVANPGFVQWLNITSVPQSQTLSLSQNSGTTIGAQVSFMFIQTYPTASSIL